MLKDYHNFENLQKVKLIYLYITLNIYIVKKCLNLFMLEQK
jgi:hypothetical protein